MKVLVTGASGGIGSHLVEAFTARGHRVTGLLRSRERARHLTWTNADIISCDVTEKSSLTDEMFDQDCIVHTVATIRGGRRWRETLAADQAGAGNVLAAAVHAGCPRFVHISSIAVLDLPVDGAVVDDTTPLRSNTGRTNRYARSKLEVERLVRNYERETGIAVTVFRPSVCLGRFDRHMTPSVLRFLRSPWAGLIGWGDNLVPCVDLAELADLIVTAAGSNRAAGRTYAVSGRKCLRLADLLTAHATGIDRPIRYRYSERNARALATVIESSARLLRRKDPPLIDRLMVDVATLNCTIDCSEASKDLGWSGRGDLRESIRQSIAWHEGVNG